MEVACLTHLHPVFLEDKLVHHYLDKEHHYLVVKTHCSKHLKLRQKEKMIVKAMKMKNKEKKVHLLLEQKGLLENQSQLN
jgi:hypothetical protein